MTKSTDVSRMHSWLCQPTGRKVPLHKLEITMVANECPAMNVCAALPFRLSLHIPLATVRTVRDDSEGLPTPGADQSRLSQCF